MKEKAERFAQWIIVVGTLTLLVWMFSLSEGVSQPAEQIRENAIRQCVAEHYTLAIGVRETTGRNDGKEVAAYLRSVQLGEGYAWCAAFVNYTLKQCGAPVANSGWSPAWFPTQKIVFGLGLNSGTLPKKGDVFGIYFASKKRIAHVGFIDSWGTTHVTTVEGNTNDAGSREGDGVYRKRRLTRQIYAVSNWISL